MLNAAVTARHARALPAVPMTGPGSRYTGAFLPVVPTFIRPEPANRLTFASVDDLARHIAKVRKGRGIRLQYAAITMLGASFPAIQVYAVDDTGAETWLGAAAIQTREPMALALALERVDPQ